MLFDVQEALEQINERFQEIENFIDHDLASHNTGIANRLSKLEEIMDAVDHAEIHKVLDELHDLVTRLHERVEALESKIVAKGKAPVAEAPAPDQPAQ